MSQEIESVKPILTVIDDEGDLILNSIGPRGKAMVQAVLALANGVRKISVISDGEMKVLKRNPAAGNQAAKRTAAEHAEMIRPNPSSIPPTGPDIQDQFAADIEAGVTGEAAMGEKPSPTPGPSDPTPTPTPAPKRRKPQIFQDAAAPPAPELAEAEMDRLLAEAAQAEKDAARVAEDQRFQRQQAVQAGQEPPVDAEEEATPAQPRKRTRERTLATTGRPCGRCGGGGQIVGDAGFAGACPVCLGEGQIKTWDRSPKFR